MPTDIHGRRMISEGDEAIECLAKSSYKIHPFSTETFNRFKSLKSIQRVTV